MNNAPEASDDAGEAFGRDVLGPIFAEFAQRLWTFQYFLPDRKDACLLFCARGGLRLGLIYERFLAQTGLQAPLPHASLMVSRLVAARTSAAAPGPALLDELNREFQGQSMADVADALAQGAKRDLGPGWEQPFDKVRFVDLLDAETPETVRLRSDIDRQDQAFRRHLKSASAGRSTVLLCDTGLYGSTVRLLAEGIPDKTWIALQFARSNYKQYAAPHFGVTVGLSVERDYYMPWNARTTVLSFWQLIEWVLEPKLQSVKSFSDEPLPKANLEIEGWRDRIPAESAGLFSGVMAYLDGLSAADLPSVGRDAERAWKKLRRFVIWPRRRDIPVLALSERSRDFGRAQVIAQDGLWRQGNLIQRYSPVGRGALALLEIAYAGRALSRIVKKRRGAGA